MFRTVIVGTDCSDSAARAVEAAADLAASQGEGAALHIVSVVKPVSTSAVAAGEVALAAPAGASADVLDSVRQELEGQLRAVAHQASRAGLTVEAHVRVGNPAEVLCDMAANLGADVIVVGNRGMQGGRRFLGSVPNTISHHAPCSVLIVDTAE